jgi:glutamyl/glutaminyl-tRNA synthetase
MFIDFGMAARYGGECILRYDDTNPEAEKQEYIDHIQDIISWLGWKPSQVTPPHLAYITFGCLLILSVVSERARF